MASHYAITTLLATRRSRVITGYLYCHWRRHWQSLPPRSTRIVLTSLHGGMVATLSLKSLRRAGAAVGRLTANIESICRDGGYYYCCRCLMVVVISFGVLSQHIAPEEEATLLLSPEDNAVCHL